MIFPFDERPAPENDPRSYSPVTVVRSGLSPAEIQRLVELGSALDHSDVGLFGGSTEEDVKARGGHYPLNDDTRWFYERMASLGRQVNEELYGYDLQGFGEPFFYRHYTAPDGHFSWHTDSARDAKYARKLTLVLQLSGPEDYDGGELQLMTYRGPLPVRRSAGLVAVFPSYQLHRVTPITRGERRAITMFMAGPNFR